MMSESSHIMIHIEKENRYIMGRIKKAKREAIYTKVLFGGCSGSGKTYSALRMATGMAEELSRISGKEERICFIDTENRRSCY